MTALLMFTGYNYPAACFYKLNKQGKEQEEFAKSSKNIAPGTYFCILLYKIMPAAGVYVENMV